MCFVLRLRRAVSYTHLDVYKRQTSKRQTSILQMFSLYSPDDSYDEKFLSNYISITLKPAILRIQGVGDMMIMGGDYSMRIWMKPDAVSYTHLQLASDFTGQ